MQACARAGAHQTECQAKAQDVLFCQLLRRQESQAASQAFTAQCGGSTAPSFIELGMRRLRSSGPEDDLAREMTRFGNELQQNC